MKKDTGLLMMAGVFSGVMGLLTACSVGNGTMEAQESSAETAESTAVTESVQSEQAEETRISFVGVGDNLIHDSIFLDVQQEDGTYDFKPIYEHVAEDIAAADIAFLNQETISAGPDYNYSGYPAFNTPEDIAGDMAELGFDLVNAATNHSLDYDYTGAINSVETWSQYPEVVYNGIYLSQEDRDTVRTIEREGVTFAFLNYTYGTNGIMPDTDYRVSYFDEEKIRRDVAKAKEISDFIIVSAHWGDENTYELNELQTTYAQLFADLGVDVVVGTHPHIIQTMEWKQGAEGNQTLVIYSLGNFIAHSLEDYNTLGGMVSFDFVMGEDGEKAIENVLFEGTVSHYTSEPYSVEKTRRNFKIYPLSEYTEELAAEHGLNGYNGIEISPANYQSMIDEVIPAEFLAPEAE